jgi:hypothetical protein
MHEKKLPVPDIILVEHNYEKSLIIREYFKSRNIARILDTFRDGIGAVDFLKSLKGYSFKLKAILLDFEIPYLNELLTSIRNDKDLKEIPLIIFSEDDKDLVTAKYPFSEQTFFSKPMQLLRCAEIINYLNRQNQN